jgi:putative NADH-flavin reductase
VRDPAKIQIEDDKLSVEKCDVFNKEEVRPHVEKNDVVLSCLGFGIQKQEPVL